MPSTDLDLTPEQLLDLIGRPSTGADITSEEVAAFLAAGHDRKTERSFLKWVSRVSKKVREKAGQGEPLAEVTIHAPRGGRVTKWAGKCEACPKVGAQWAERTKRESELHGIAHIREQHDNAGRLLS